MFAVWLFSVRFTRWSSFFIFLFCYVECCECGFFLIHLAAIVDKFTHSLNISVENWWWINLTSLVARNKKKNFEEKNLWDTQKIKNCCWHKVQLITKPECITWLLHKWYLKQFLHWTWPKTKRKKNTHKNFFK